MPSSGPPHEVRLGVVTYGGVSLAVEMSGVARELFNLVHASRVEHVAVAPGGGASRASDSEAVDAPGGAAAGSRSGAVHAAPGDSLADVYRALIAAMGEDVGAVGGARRVSVDGIVGASAGGINGVYLAKVLAAGAPPAAVDDAADAPADGGYLDNKPFGHAIDLLGATAARRRVTRKLLYVEPTPELDVRSEVIEPPNVIVNDEPYVPAWSLPGLLRSLQIRADGMRLHA